MPTQGSSKIGNSERGPAPGEAYGAAGLTWQAGRRPFSNF